MPVRGSRMDEEAVKLACLLTKKVKGKIYAAYIIRVAHALPLDAEVETDMQQGEEVLRQAEGTAVGEGCEVETDLLQARKAGPAIIEEAIERDIDLIILGLEHKKRFGEVSLGETVPYVLKHAPCRVLVCRESITE